MAVDLLAVPAYAADPVDDHRGPEALAEIHRASADDSSPDEDHAVAFHRDRAALLDTVIKINIKNKLEQFGVQISTIGLCCGGPGGPFGGPGRGGPFWRGGPFH